MIKACVLIGLGCGRRNHPFVKGSIYEGAYRVLSQQAEEQGVQFYRCKNKSFSFTTGRFSSGWTLRNNKWVRVKNIKPDVLLDKSTAIYRSETFRHKVRMSTYAPIVNSLDFTMLFGSKMFTYTIFSKFMKKSIRVTNASELRDAAKQLKTNRIVVKPVYGSSGKDISIVTKDKIRTVQINRPMIAQEFIDSSKGIKGLTDTVHDLRLVFESDSFIYSYIRTPVKGSLLANVAQGGSMKIVTKKEMPKKVWDIIKEVHASLRPYFPGIYTIDLMFDKQQQPWIVELNTMPGIYFYEDQKKWQDRFYAAQIKILKNAVNKR